MADLVINISIDASDLDQSMENVKTLVEWWWEKNIHKIAQAGHKGWERYADTKIRNNKLKTDYKMSLDWKMLPHNAAQIGLYTGRRITSSRECGPDGSNLVEGGLSGPFYPRSWEIGLSGAVGIKATHGANKMVPIGPWSKAPDRITKWPWWVPVKGTPRSMVTWKPSSAPGFHLREETKTFLVEQIIPDTFAEIGKIKLSLSTMV